MNVHICRPSSVTQRKVIFCPTCQRRRRFVVQSFVWYPSMLTCTACGDTWGEEGRYPRPFARGWRAQSSAAAKARWATALPPGEAREALREMVAAS